MPPLCSTPPDLFTSCSLCDMSDTSEPTWTNPRLLSRQLIICLWSSPFIILALLADKSCGRGAISPPAAVWRSESSISFIKINWSAEASQPVFPCRAEALTGIPQRQLLFELSPLASQWSSFIIMNISLLLEDFFWKEMFYSWRLLRVWASVPPISPFCWVSAHI